MNESTLDGVYPQSKFRERVFGTRSNRQSSAFYGYSLTLIATGIGWLLRGRTWIVPDDGLGYWLGIIGGTMMLVLILYPLRKRVRALRFFGQTAYWFKAHMILGVAGPVLILFHSNFQIGSFNSQVALYCMLLVAGSGVVGRHIYARIHSGLYGGKTSLDELRLQLAKSLDQSSGMTNFMPKFSAQLEALSEEVQGCSLTGSLGFRSSLAWTIRKYFVWFSLWRAARAEIAERAATSAAVAANVDKLQQVSSSYIRNFVRLVGRVAQFTLYERLFSLWHVLHMPLFFMMLISAVVHVLAVHMY